MKKAQISGFMMSRIDQKERAGFVKGFLYAKGFSPDVEITCLRAPDGGFLFSQPEAKDVVKLQVEPREEGGEADDGEGSSSLE